MNTTVHIFAGNFADRDAAVSYSEEQWLPEPGDDASDEEYAKWEATNPRWAMRDDLGLEYLDHDFIETLHEQDEGGPGLWAYVGGLLRDHDVLEHVQNEAASSNTLVLIFEQAFGGAEPRFRTTRALKFCGIYAAHLGEQE